MTSRRSRLKAVTNLPVRRKVLTSNENTDETSPVDNAASEKVYSLSQKTNEVTVPLQSTPQLHDNEKNINKSKITCEKEENTLIVQSTEQLQSCDNSKNVDETSESTFPKVLDTFDTCGSETDCGISSPLKSIKNFKPSLKSASIETSHVNEEIQNVENQSCNEMTVTNMIIDTPSNIPVITTSTTASSNTTISNIINFNSENRINKNNNSYKLKNNSNSYTTNNNNINKNNNNNNNINNDSNKNNSSIIIKDGVKCYTLLTSENISLSSLSEYTITPLTPCETTYANTALNDIYSTQEFEEVQIYNEPEPNNLCISNEIEGNCNSITETQSSDYLIRNVNSCNEAPEINNIGYKTLTEVRNASESLFLKPSTKSKAVNVKINLSRNDEYSKNSETRDSHILESLVTSGLQSPSSHPYRQGISTVKRKRSKCNDFTKKLAEAKREFQKKYEKTKPDRSTLKMIDLIFYNPATNPMESKSKFDKKDAPGTPSDTINELLEEEKVDEPDMFDNNSKSVLCDNEDTENKNKMPVPQVKIGLDGEIILDEKSLIIETTDAKKGREELQNSVPIFEDRGCKVSYYRGKSRKSRDWADFETKRFYKALNTIGPDFTLMQKYFPKRSRLELKNKFKREERLNRNLIDKALNNPSEFDMTQLEKDLAREKEAEEEETDLRLCRVMKHPAKRPKIKSSLLSREMIESDGESENSQTKSLDANSKWLLENEKNKKKKEFDFVLQKLLMKDSEKSFNNLPDISTSTVLFQQTKQGLL